MRKVECDEHSGNYLPHKIQKWLKVILQLDVALSNRAVAITALRQGSKPYRSSVPCICGWVYQEYFLPFHIYILKKKKRKQTKTKKKIYWLGCPRASGRISLFIKSINVMLSSSSHKIGLGLSLFSKAYKNLDIREKNWNPISATTKPRSLRKPHSWHLVLDFWKFRTWRNLSASSCSPCSDIRDLKCEACVRVNCNFTLATLCPFKANSSSKWMLPSCEEIWEGEHGS